MKPSLTRALLLGSLLASGACREPVSGPALISVSVGVPTRLRVERTPERIGIAIDPTSLVPTEMRVTNGMTTGVEAEVRVFPAGETASRPAGISLGSGLGFDIGTSFVNRSEGGIPAPGQTYVVEVAIEAFETDVPADHMWRPRSGKYRVIWRGMLTATVE